MGWVWVGSIFVGDDVSWMRRIGVVGYTEWELLQKVMLCGV
jgi:hypothetical protein